MTNVTDYLKKSASKHPEKIAFYYKESGISYKNLLENSKKIASNFTNYYNKPIAIFMDKSIECVTSMMGIITSGNFYTIIDTKMPKDRIDNILNTLEPVLIVTTENLLLKTKELGFKNVVVFEELLNTEINEQYLEEVSQKAIDTDPIYVLFTSGSTGVPKGYTINHRGVIDFCEAMTETFKLSEEDVFANQSPLYFDLSIADIYCNIKNGSTNYLMPQSMFMFPIKVVEFLNEHKINTIFWIPSALVLISQALEKEQPKYLKRVMFCGEAMPNKQLNIWRKYLKETMFANLYGPAETVDASTFYIIDREFKDDEVLPIGKPFKNTKVFILDENNKEVTEKDVVGELCIAGSSLAMGYYNNKEKTNASFIQNPLNDKYIEPIYKTGDLVKYNEFKELVYVSRKDYQIKHMGYRIELGEIETAVSGIKEIRQNACIYDNELKKIVLFYEGEELSNSYIINALKTKLPNYMLPNKIIKLEHLPLNANGKIDRKKLKEVKE